MALSQGKQPHCQCFVVKRQSSVSCLLKWIAWKEMTGPVPRAVRRCPQETHTRPLAAKRCLCITHCLTLAEPPSALTFTPHMTGRCGRWASSSSSIPFSLLCFSPPLLPTNLPPQRNCLTSLLPSFLPYYVTADAFSSSNHLSFKTGLNGDFPGGPGV